jgi:hypothetical protein
LVFRAGTKIDEEVRKYEPYKEEWEQWNRDLYADHLDAAG